MSYYHINEIFYSLQGEGVRAGTANVFVRFSGCNLTCSRDNEAGFDCDTEFTSGKPYSAASIFDIANCLWPGGTDGKHKAVIFTGGEPLLQLKSELVSMFQDAGWYVAIETNGTRELPEGGGIDWICVSPKSAEHTLRIKRASEVKYVRHRGQAIPRPSIEADYYLISPAFQPGGFVNAEDLGYCIELVKANPQWRLSCQLHKGWVIR